MVEHADYQPQPLGQVKFPLRAGNPVLPRFGGKYENHEGGISAGGIFPDDQCRFCAGALLAGQQQRPLGQLAAGEYARQARGVLAEIKARGHLPIVVGGTGLRTRALDCEADCR